jgi:hypothetical protein
MKQSKRIELGDVFYVFTNWGICRGRIVKIIDEMVEIGKDVDGKEMITGQSQFKLNIDIDDENKDKKYGFFYVRHQLFYRLIDALKYECSRWGMKELIE